MEVVDGVQVVNSTLQSGRYPNITVQAGVSVKWVIDAPNGSINGCNNRILIQDYGINYTFHTGENVIEFTPTNTGTVHYSCWMGMIRGNIFVTDGSEGDVVAFGGEVRVPTPTGYVPVYWNIENSMAGAESGTDLLIPYYSTQLLLGLGENLLSLYPSDWKHPSSVCNWNAC